jgi:hypothetical protein
MGFAALPPPTPALGSAAPDEPELSCQPEDDFCEPGCESPSMDCIDDVNIGDDGEDSSDEGDDSGDSGGDDSGDSGGDDSGDSGGDTGGDEGGGETFCLLTFISSGGGGDSGGC